MEIRVLQYFLMVAREENITRAAQLLHLTQPTLSRQMIQLEEELGVALFHRSNHRVTLTEEGMLLRRRAQEIVDLADKTKMDIQRREQELSGTLTIGAGELLSSQVLAKLLAGFRARHPLVSFQLYSAQADDIKERIDQGLLDIGLVPEPVDKTRYLFLTMPVTERWGALVQEGSPLAGKQSLSPEDLCGVPLLLPQRELIHRELAGWFGPHWEHLQVVGTGNLLFNQAVLAREIPGCCVITMWKLDTRFPNMVFVPLSPQITGSSLLIWKKAETFSPVTSAFLRHARAYLSGMETHPNQVFDREAPPV